MSKRKQKNEPITQHYIPQFYLSRFCRPDGKFSVYDKLQCKHLKNCRPRNFAAQNHYYNVTEDELREVLAELTTLHPELTNTIDFTDKTYLEKRFVYYEGAFSEILRDIDNDVSSLQDECTKNKLAVLMYELYVRTPSYRNEQNYIHSVTHEHLANSFAVPCDNSEKCFEDYSPKAARIKQLKNIVSIEASLKNCLPWLDDYEWILGINNTDLPFITTDNPTHQLVIGIKDFCFPINGSKAIILRKKGVEDNSFSVHDKSIEDDNIIYLTVCGVMIYNILNLVGGYRFIFGDDRAIRIVANAHKTTGMDTDDRSRYY